ncbi:MAG: glycosyltransferase [Methylococcales bacterium]|nr:glycosyltransferase [Methylococcaceae bacterium]
MQPSISVVIPLYNKAPHIHHTLNSVLAQRQLPIEIIVVDDGSIDDSAEVVARMENPLIKLHKQANQGVSSARNQGVMLASGSHIAFLDADDIWTPHHIETLLTLIQRFPDLGVYSSMHVIQNAHATIRPRFAFPEGSSNQVDDFFARFAAGLSLINSSTACIRRDALIAIGGFPEGINRGEDIIVWIKLARQYAMAHTATVTAIYNRDAVNRSVKLRETEAPGSLIYLAELLNGNLDSTEHASALLLFSRMAFYTCAGMCEQGNYGAVLAIRRLAKQSGLWRLYAKITVLLTIPSFVLTFARRFRHKL